MALPCNSCVAGTLISVSILSQRNPIFLNANYVTSSFEIYTLNNSPIQYIDGRSTGLLATPNLAGQASIILSAQVDTTIVNKQTYLTLALITNSDMTSAGIFDIYFPDQFIYTQPNADCFISLGTN
jgi:hypothetical protein